MPMKNKKPFIVEQLDEALEERQNPDRRKSHAGFSEHSDQERRKANRRASTHKKQA